MTNDQIILEFLERDLRESTTRMLQIDQRLQQATDKVLKGVWAAQLNDAIAVVDHLKKLIEIQNGRIAYDEMREIDERIDNFLDTER